MLRDGNSMCGTTMVHASSDSRQELTAHTLQVQIFGKAAQSKSSRKTADKENASSGYGSGLCYPMSPVADHC